jgi:hypothetical protein
MIREIQEGRGLEDQRSWIPEDEDRCQSRSEDEESRRKKRDKSHRTRPVYTREVKNNSQVL